MPMDEKTKMAHAILLSASLETEKFLKFLDWKLFRGDVVGARKSLAEHVSRQSKFLSQIEGICGEQKVAEA